MAPSSEQALRQLTRRVQELEADLHRAGAEPAAPTGSRQRARNPWLGAALLIAATWGLSAQAPATLPADVEQRLRALEGLVRRGPGDITQMTAPFEVVGADGKPIVRVGLNQDGSVPVTISKIAANGGGVVAVSSGDMVQAVMEAPPGHGVVSALDGKEVRRAQLLGVGGVIVRDPSGAQIAGLTQADGSGRIGIWRGDNKVIDITTDAASGGSGVVKVNTPSGETVARLSTVDGAGELVVSNKAGQPLARVGPDAQNGGAGGIKVMSAGGKVVAGVLGGVRGAGAVVVANSAGQPLAEMSVSTDGRGLFQVLGAGAHPVAVLTQGPDKPGGLLQISNASSAVANLTVGPGGAGYLQLNNAVGQPTVEGGTLSSGQGVVRAGPGYKCFPVQASSPVATVGLPDCIKGEVK